MNNIVFGIFFFQKILQVLTTTSQCDICQKVVQQFIRHFEDSSGHGFGGGNTHWEEKNQGLYYHSESRLMDIIDKIYKQNTDHQSNNILSTIEESIETWWMNPFKNGQAVIESLEEYVCYTVNPFCCPVNTFGSNCSSCKPCSIHGKCDGNGTRFGTGECICAYGFSGNVCESCNLKTHFELKKNTDNASLVNCLPCNDACMDGCLDQTPDTCTNCKPGWEPVTDINKNGKKSCADVDECYTSSHSCKKNEFCVNTVGHYLCEACHHSCSDCKGPLEKDCTTCNLGYSLSNENVCKDIDECSSNSNICSGDNEMCINTDGSYICSCKSGYIRISGQCTKHKNSNKMHISKSISKDKNYLSRNPLVNIFLFEIVKLIILFLLFLIIFYIFSNRLIMCLSISVLAVAYVYKQSIIFDYLFYQQN